MIAEADLMSSAESGQFPMSNELQGGHLGDGFEDQGWPNINPTARDLRKAISGIGPLGFAL